MIIEDLWKYYGDELIFKEVHAVIGPTDRIGLVGANGAGKTTLLRTLAGYLSPDRGSITCPGGFTLGFLGQQILDQPQTLGQYLQEPFAEQIALEKSLGQLERELAQLEPGPELDQTLERYSRLRDRFEHGGGYDYLVQINQVITGLGFAQEDLERLLTTFSGGEQMRISLARLLLDRPSLLILDEPTNHLDLEATRWLEDFLASYPRAFIVVSHDRYFLDRIAQQIWELHGQRLYQYKGNYSQYLPQRALRQQQLEESLERLAEERARMEAFIQKFKAGTRARQAKSMEKKLARLPDLERVLDDPSMTIRFEPKRPSGSRVLTLEDVRKSFGDREVLKGISAEVRRGEHIALLGPNGSGKTTLLKILAGKLDCSGSVQWGTGAEVGYFSQQISLDPENTVLEELYAEHRLELGVLRSVLARFLFKGEDVFKQTTMLSGGERSRLALAKLLLHRPNVLLLDEPTNHLDVFAREALEQTLAEFSGTIIFVSHDRYFIDKLASKIWLLEDGRLQQYAGGYRDFEQARAAQAAELQARAPKPGPDKPRRSAAKHRERLRLLEEEIVDLEERLAKLEAALASPELYQDESQSVPVIQEYQELQLRLTEKYEEWECLVEAQEEE
ncbi:MAG TPA: ABC-F family ATP-binding cassette domain-containing protein [Limnochordia bacterium]|nr:ABC-F family ATP-binding cassette domain-containing protein [Limnochordia bacterium]